jgi:glycosyltransferase involved in cell wall biosynthesis
VSPLRVLIATESLEVWGAEGTLLELSQQVDRAAVELTFILAPSSPLAPLVSESGFDVLFHRYAIHPALVKYGGLGGASKLALLQEVANALLGGIRFARIARRFDLVLSFSMWQAIETAIGSSIARRPFVLDIHETFNGTRGHQVLRMLAQISRAVIAPSAAILSRSGLVPSEKIVVIPRPVSTGRLESTRTRSETMTIGIFGQISAHKGVAKVVSALSSVPGDRVKLLVVGGRPDNARGEYEAKVRDSVKKMGGGSIVVDRVSNVHELMAACDFVINASDHEAFGRGVVESIAAGAIPIAVGMEGPSEIVRATGIGVILGSVDELPGFVKEILDGSAELPEVSLSLRESALRLYHPATVANEYFDTLQRAGMKGSNR